MQALSFILILSASSLLAASFPGRYEDILLGETKLQQGMIMVAIAS